MARKISSALRSRKSSDSFENSRWFVPVVFLVLFLALAFLFSDFIFSDQMLYSSDPLQASVMFRIYQTDYMAANNWTIPQWMPHQFGGMPFVEAFHSDIFYPPTLAIKCLQILYYDTVKPIDVARTLGWMFFLHIFLSGIFMYRAARQFKLTRTPALLAGASYMLAGYLVSMVAPGHDGKIYVAALFPAMMFFLDRGFEKDFFFDKLKYFSLTGLSIGMILLTPHPQMSYFSLWALSFFAAFRLIVIWVKQKSIIPTLKPGLLVVYAVAIGLMFSAIQMYPGIKYTSEYSPRADTKKGWDWATSWSLHEEEAASLIIPEFSGTSTSKAETFYWGKNAFKDNSEWVGTVPFFIALLGLAYYRRRKEAYFFGGLGLFALLYGLGATTPFFRIMFMLVPKVESMRSPSMIMFLCSFSVAMLAAMGLQAVLDRRDDAKQKTGFKFNYLLLGFPSLLLLLALLFSVAGRSMLDIWAWFFYSGASSQLVQQGVTKLDVAYMNLPAIQSGAWLAFFFTGLSAACIWLYRQGKVGAGILIAVVAIVMVNGVRFNNRFFSLVDSNRFNNQYGETSLTKYLAGQPEKWRVVNLGTPKDANMPVHGIDVLVGYHGNQLRWYDDLLGGPALTTVPEGRLLQMGRLANARFVNLAGTKFLIDPTQGLYRPEHFGTQPVTKLADLGSAQLLQNDNAFPRVYLVDKYQVIAGDTVIYRSAADSVVFRKVVLEVLGGSSDMRHTVLLEEEPTLEIPLDSASTDSTWIINYHADSVRVGVKVAKNKLLVMTDTWFNAWHVTIDGSPAKLLRAYGAFRAIEIPAGSKQVFFEYKSERFALGKTVTWATALYLLGIISCSIYWGRRYEQASEMDREKEEEKQS